MLVDPLKAIRNVLAETDATGSLTDGFYVWLRAQDASYAASDAPVTGSDFNAKLCAYSKLDATKVQTTPPHVGYFTNDTPRRPPENKFILIQVDHLDPHAAGGAGLGRAG